MLLGLLAAFLLLILVLELVALLERVMGLAVRSTEEGSQRSADGCGEDAAAHAAGQGAGESIEAQTVHGDPPGGG
jgi:hypothetical protein